jgi:hypothetical protein
MKKLFLTVLMAVLCAGAIVAQDRVQKVITIKNGNLNGIWRTIKDLAPASNLVISNDGEHIILSGSKDTVTSFEEIIKQLDVPPVVKRDVETTVYMIVASSQPGNAAPMTAELEPVIKQLKTIFNYKSFRLLDNFVLRSRDGEKGSTDGFLTPIESLPPNNKISYGFRFNRVTIDGAENARLIRFDALHLSMKVPVGTAPQVSFAETGISTDVDVPEGKKVVVGKTSGIEGSDSALVLVISAKVVD